MTREGRREFPRLLQSIYDEQKKFVKEINASKDKIELLKGINHVLKEQVKSFKGAVQKLLRQNKQLKDEVSRHNKRVINI